MDFLKRNIAPIIGGVVCTIILGLLSTLYAQQNKKIDTKADQQMLIQMVKNLEAVRKIENERVKEERAERKVQIKQMNDTLNNLNHQIWILNQSLKIKGGQND